MANSNSLERRIAAMIATVTVAQFVNSDGDLVEAIKDLLQAYVSRLVGSHEPKRLLRAGYEHRELDVLRPRASRLAKDDLGCAFDERLCRTDRTRWIRVDLAIDAIQMF